MPGTQHFAQQMITQTDPLLIHVLNIEKKKKEQQNGEKQERMLLIPDVLFCSIPKTK